MKKNHLALYLCLLLITACTAGEEPIATNTTQPEEMELTEPTPGETPMTTDAPEPKEIEIIRDVAYLDDGLKVHTLDLYLPGEQEGTYPTLLMLHGGNGKKEDFSYWGDVFSKKGYAVISINYRQWPDHQYPKNLEDAYCALSWIVNNSHIYHLDPERIFFLGHSAGGTLAASLGIIDDPTILATTCPDQLPEDFQAAGIITFTVISDYRSAALLSQPMKDYVVDYLGGTSEEVPEIWTQASPSHWVSGDEPPFLLIHGELDQSIPPSQSEEFAEILKSAGVQADLLIIPFGSHMQVKDSTQSMEAVEDFISRIITPSQ